MATEVLFKLKIDRSGDKPVFEEIKRDLQDLDRSGKVNVGFKNISELKAELAQIQRVRDNAFDFKTAEAAQRDVKRLENEIENLNKDLGKVGQGNVFQRLGQQAKSSIGDIGKIAIGSAIGTGIADSVTQGLKAVIDLGSKFESGVADLSAITGIAGQDLEALGGKARDLALEFGTSATDQLDSFKGILSRLGPDIASVPEALGSITESVNILSKATGDDAAASMDALTTAALQFGTDLSDPIAAADDITKKMNTMAAGAKVGAAEVPQVAEALKQAGVAAKGANLTFEETNAAIQVFAAGGKVGSEAGVSLRNILSSLQKQTGEGEKALTKLGTSTAKISKLLTEEGLGAALNELSGGLDKVGSDAERNKVLFTLFGDASSAAAGILLDNTGKLAEFTEGVTGTNTAVEQAAIRQATFSERMAKVGAFFEDLAITVFQALGDSISFIVDNFETLALVLVPPIGVVVQLIKHFDDLVAIGEDVGNFLGLISDTDAANADAARTVERAAEAYETYQTAIVEADNAVRTATAQVDAVKRLEELRSQTSLTAKDQKELAAITSKLADTFPEATAGVNDLTGEYEVNLDKLKELSAEQERVAGEDRRKQIEENLLGPTRDLLPALDAQKEKLAELRAELDEAIQDGDKEDILEARDAYEEQRASIKGTTEQLDKNIQALIKSGAVGKGSAEEIAKGLGISRAEAEKLIPKVQQINKDLKEQEDQAKKTAESISGIGAAFNEAAAAAKTQLEESKAGLAGLFDQLRDAQARRDKQAVADLKKRIAEEVKIGKQRVTEVKNDEKAITDAERALGLGRAAASQSEFEKIKALLDLQAKDRETTIVEHEAEITDRAIEEFRAGKRKEAQVAKSEEAALAKERFDALKKQRDDIIDKLAKTDAEGNIIGVKPGVKKGEEAKTLSELQATVAALDKQLADSKLNLVKLGLIVGAAERDKLARDIQDIVNKMSEEEIAIGIRPKEDTFDLIDLKIKQLEKDILEKQLTIKFDSEGNPIGVTTEAIKAVADAEAQIRALKAESAKLQKDLDAELNGERIGNITDNLKREEAALKLKQDNELAAFRIREASGIALTARELSLKREIEKRHQRELKDLREKFYNEDFDLQVSIARAASDAIMKTFQDAFADKQKLSKEDADLQRNEFAKREAELQQSLAKGAIAQSDFTAQMQKLTQERGKFEEDQAAFSFGKVVDTIKNSYNAALDATTAYFEKIWQTYITDQILHEQLEGIKLAQTEATTAAKITSIDSGIQADKAGAEASGLAASVEAVKKALIALPFPFNIAASIAAGLLISKAISGLAGLVKFEKGGVLVGEKGPEIIGSKRDFAQFATQLTLMTSKSIERKLGERKTTESGGGSDGTPREIRLKGSITGRGKTIKGTIDTDTIGRRSEVLGVR